MMFRGKKRGRMVDMHCHILPAVDDGAKDMEQTMEMLHIAEQEGIEAMIVTPHYKARHRNADADTILHKIHEVQEKAASEGCHITLYPGNEILYFDGAAELLENGGVLSLNNTDRALVEFYPTDDYRYIRNALDCVKAAGYVPVLAHVERYHCMVNDWKRVRELKQLGVEIQINASSAMGQIGRPVQDFIFTLLKNKLVDYVGTDAHNTHSRKPEFQSCYRKLVRKFDESYIDDIFYENAMAIIDAG